MKIGLIGNMNNNNFAMMRYFRDLGVDAHLLLYTNDGKDTLSHFSPESDTWEIEKWKPYIHQTDIPNAPIAALDFPFSWLMCIRAWIRYKIGRQETFVPAVSKHQVKCAYKGYDRLIASGITPATLVRIHKELDIFYPYSINVEFLYTGEFVKLVSSTSRFSTYIFNKIQKRQADGIRLASNTLNYEPGITEAALQSIGVNPVRLPTPIVYSGEKFPAASPNSLLANTEKLIEESSISLLHHARLLWKNNGQFTNEEWRSENKNSHWVIRAFSDFILARPNAKPRLFIIEYGPDIEATKELISQLGISKYVTWLPKMQRRELMWLLSRVSIGVGEFLDVPKMVWGGTGWETLASGKPFLQGFNFKQGAFEQIFDYPPPPMLPVRKQEDVFFHLLDMADNPNNLEQIGQEAKEWFNRNNGIGLAKQWLELLVKPN